MAPGDGAGTHQPCTEEREPAAGTDWAHCSQGPRPCQEPLQQHQLSPAHAGEPCRDTQGQRGERGRKLQGSQKSPSSKEGHWLGEHGLPECRNKLSHTGHEGMRHAGGTETRGAHFPQTCDTLTEPYTAQSPFF